MFPPVTNWTVRGPLPSKPNDCRVAFNNKIFSAKARSFHNMGTAPAMGCAMGTLLGATLTGLAADIVIDAMAGEVVMKPSDTEQCVIFTAECLGGVIGAAGGTEAVAAYPYFPSQSKRNERKW